VLDHIGDEATEERCRQGALALCKAHPVYQA
jgi:hypothetical protein